MDRQILAYILLAILIAAFIAIVFYRRHHGHAQTYKRTEARQREEYRVASAKRAEAAEQPVL
ncbi:hypothetical protein [Escherichia coli]|uniref:hypothetical protein n=1 Tax=Escherichia coli TaxID=562 RepID=UPI00190B8F25|nr:hypothetical protein [Escherichia coli]MBK2451659.1 hypothetical protein [Escherichia coli]